MGEPKVCLIGEKFKNNQGYEFEIIEVLPKSKRKIKFIESGFEKTSGTKEILNGSMLDNSKPLLKENENWINLKVGKMTIIKSVGMINGNHSYECLCDCGNTQIKSASTIRNALRTNANMSCGCSKIKDITGQKFGKLTAIKFVTTNKHGGAIWECECECGNKKVASADHLKQGNVTRCNTCPQTDNITGNKYGRLTVIEYIPKSAKWKCLCSCGNYKISTYSDLFTGKVKSCGCLQHETTNNLTHGLSDTRLYTIFRGMKQRCYYKKNNYYDIYGGKGVKICDEWLDKESGFLNFYNWAMNNGYEDGLTIDRIDSNGNYEPINCRWATYEEQGNNTSKNVYITYKNETKTMSQWSKELNINYSSLRSFCQKYGSENAYIYINKKLEAK
jgi:hypothetical protein